MLLNKNYALRNIKQTDTEPNSKLRNQRHMKFYQQNEGRKKIAKKFSPILFFVILLSINSCYQQKLSPKDLQSYIAEVNASSRLAPQEKSSRGTNEWIKVNVLSSSIYIRIQAKQNLIYNQNKELIFSGLSSGQNQLVLINKEGIASLVESAYTDSRGEYIIFSPAAIYISIPAKNTHIKYLR